MVQDAKQDVAEANLAMNNAIAEFKLESAELITANEKKSLNSKTKLPEKMLRTKPN
jgi:hypothetical protein